MSARILCITLLCAFTSFGVWGELSYEATWQVSAGSGFSAPNLLRDPATGEPLAVVACELGQGVACFGLGGARLWNYPMEPAVTAAPAVADLDGDGREDVVAGDSTGTLVTLDGQGALMWSVQLPGAVMADSCPAVADLDGDGRPEVLVGQTLGILSCLDNQGRLLWQFTGDGTRMGPTLVADIYDTPGKEIVVTSHDRHVYMLTAEGEWLWDLYFHDDLFPNTTPLLADVDGNNVPELYIGGGLHHFYRIDLATAQVTFEENVYLHINSCIAATDLDGDGKDEVVFGNKTGGIWCYGDEGFKWTKRMPASYLYAAPIFLNVDEDPELEIVFHSLLADLQVLDTDGTTLFTGKTPCTAGVTPIAGDLDGDGMLEMVSTQYGGGGKIAWGELGIPYADDARNRTMFAGDRAHTCQPPQPKAYPLLPAPKTSPASIKATATPERDLMLLSGRNTWRFNVANPSEQRLALVMSLACPDGTTQRFVRHVHTSTSRQSVAFDVAVRGSYTVESRLVAADGLGLCESSTLPLGFKGFKSDRAYLENTVFAAIEEELEGWRATNPRAADHFARELIALRGMLTQLAKTDNDERVKRVASLRRDAERLQALATAGAALAPSGSFFPWEFTPWAYFDPRDSLPTPQDRTEELAASVCVGEYESFAVNLTNVCERTLDVRVICNELKGETTYPAEDHLEFRHAVTVPTLRREWVSDALPKLDEGRLVRIAALESEQLWITLNAEGLEPGEYVVNVRLRSLEPDPTEVVLPIKLTVHDLVLPRPRPLRFCLWAGSGGPTGVDKDYVLEDLVEHGVTIFFGSSPSAKADENGNLIGELDFTAHDKTAARYSPHGMLLYVGPQGAVQGVELFSEAWRKAFIAYLRAWVAHMNEIGMDYGDWALYPYDEPSTPYTQTTLDLVKVAKVVREADPNILIYTDPTSGTTMETVEMFTGLIDIWCPSYELLTRLGPEMVPVAHEVGKEVWFYDALGRAKTLSCLGNYRWWFWYAWTLDFTGAGWYSYAQSGGDRWDGPNMLGCNYSTIYDAPDSVVSSKRWEVAREGIEDYEYLYLLREAIRDAEQRGVPADKLADAKALLAELPKQIEQTLIKVDFRMPLTTDSVPLYERATEVVHDARRRIVDACLEVKGM